MVAAPSKPTLEVITETFFQEILLLEPLPSFRNILFTPFSVLFSAKREQKLRFTHRRVSVSVGSAWDHVSPRRSRRAGTAAHPLNIASRIPRHRTSPPTAPPAISAALWEPHQQRWQILSTCTKHINHVGSTQVMGSMGWVPGSHPAN